MIVCVAGLDLGCDLDFWFLYIYMETSHNLAPPLLPPPHQGQPQNVYPPPPSPTHTYRCVINTHSPFETLSIWKYVVIRNLLMPPPLSLVPLASRPSITIKCILDHSRAPPPPPPPPPPSPSAKRATRKRGAVIVCKKHISHKYHDNMVGGVFVLACTHRTFALWFMRVEIFKIAINSC